MRFRGTNEEKYKIFKEKTKFMVMDPDSISEYRLARKLVSKHFRLDVKPYKSFIERMKNETDLHVTHTTRLLNPEL